MLEGCLMGCWVAMQGVPWRLRCEALMVYRLFRLLTSSFMWVEYNTKGTNAPHKEVGHTGQSERSNSSRV
jgi:hypothetical protein